MTVQDLFYRFKIGKKSPVENLPPGFFVPSQDLLKRHKKLTKRVVHFRQSCVRIVAV